MSVEPEKIEERMKELESTKMVSAKELRHEILVLKRLRKRKLAVSDSIEKEFKRIFGNEWSKYPELVKIVERQKELENHAIDRWVGEIKRWKK